MKSYLQLLALLLISMNTVAQWQTGGTLGIDIRADTAILKDDSAWRNCGSEYDMIVTQDGYHIVWTQKNHGGVALCDCPFDFSVTLANLQQGNYTADVYYIEYSPTPIFIGTLNFEIDATPPDSVHILNPYQSTCLLQGVGEEKRRVNGITAYPNPFRGSLNVNVLNTLNHEELTAEIYDCLGRLLWVKKVQDAPFVLEPGDLPAGIYLLRVMDGTGIVLGSTRIQTY